MGGGEFANRAQGKNIIYEVVFLFHFQELTQIWPNTKWIDFNIFKSAKNQQKSCYRKRLRKIMGKS